MQTQFKTITLKTERKVQLVDITHEVEEFVSRSAVVDGACVVHAPHATAAVMLNENEPGLVSDIESKISSMFSGPGYSHDRIDDNASSHIGSAFLGNSRTLLIRNGKLIRGTWQNIFFVELDGPKIQREVVIEVLGD